MGDSPINKYRFMVSENNTRYNELMGSINVSSGTGTSSSSRTSSSSSSKSASIWKDPAVMASLVGGGLTLAATALPSIISAFGKEKTNPGTTPTTKTENDSDGAFVDTSSSTSAACKSYLKAKEKATKKNKPDSKAQKEADSQKAALEAKKNSLQRQLDILPSPEIAKQEYERAKVDYNKAVTRKGEVEKNVLTLYDQKNEQKQKVQEIINQVNDGKALIKSTLEPAVEKAEANVTSATKAVATAEANVTSATEAVETAEANVASSATEEGKTEAKNALKIAQSNLTTANTAKETADKNLAAANTAKETADKALEAKQTEINELETVTLAPAQQTYNEVEAQWKSTSDELKTLVDKTIPDSKKIIDENKHESLVKQQKSLNDQIAQINEALSTTATTPLTIEKP